jgi:hypothetical protein
VQLCINAYCSAPCCPGFPECKWCADTMTLPGMAKALQGLPVHHRSASQCDPTASSSQCSVKGTSCISKQSSALNSKKTRRQPTWLGCSLLGAHTSACGWEVAWRCPLNVPLLQQLQKGPPDHGAGCGGPQACCVCTAACCRCCGCCRVCCVCCCTCIVVLCLDGCIGHAGQHSLHNLVVPTCTFEAASSSKGGTLIGIERPTAMEYVWRKLWKPRKS